MKTFSVANLRERFKCGKYKPLETDRGKIEKAQKEAKLIETRQVASQPHRNGDGTDMAGSNLGKFINEQFAEYKEYERRGIYTAANSYLWLTCAWRKKRGVPMPLRSTYWDFETLADCPLGERMEIPSEEEFLNDEEIEELVKKWKKRITELNLVMARVGRSSLNATKDLILDDKKLHPEMKIWVRRCLLNLAKAQGWD